MPTIGFQENETCTQTGQCPPVQGNNATWFIIILASSIGLAWMFHDAIKTPMVKP